jgi:hypothetical protein
MTCSQCGNEATEGTDFCRKCGTKLAGSAAPATPANVPIRPAASAYSFDAARWTLNDRIAGGATLVVLISLFLPWFSVNLGALAGDLGVSPGIATASGTETHGWLWFVFIIGLLVLLYLVAWAGLPVLPVKLPLSHEQLLLGATGLNLFLVVLAFLLKPGGAPVGWSFGAFVALIAAIAAVVPLVRALRVQAASTAASR